MNQRPVRHLITVPELPDLPLASCRDIPNPDLFFPAEKIVSNLILKQISKICSECPENVACLKYSLDNRIREGFWGGVSPQEREVMRPRNNRPEKGDALREVDRLLAMGMTLERACEERGIKIESYKNNKVRKIQTQHRGQENE